LKTRIDEKHGRNMSSFISDFVKVNAFRMYRTRPLTLHVVKNVTYSVAYSVANITCTSRHLFDPQIPDIVEWSSYTVSFNGTTVKYGSQVYAWLLRSTSSPQLPALSFWDTIAERFPVAMFNPTTSQEDDWLFMDNVSIAPSVFLPPPNVACSSAS
jgi:hypothetical protein